MSTVIILCVALLFLGMGGYGLLAPAKLVRPFGIAVTGIAGRTEVRAVYGGFGIAIAAVLVVAALDLGNLRVGAATAVAIALLGMAGGRLVSRMIEASSNFYPVWFYFWIEIVAAGLLLVAVLA